MFLISMGNVKPKLIEIKSEDENKESEENQGGEEDEKNIGDDKVIDICQDIFVKKMQDYISYWILKLLCVRKKF